MEPLLLLLGCLRELYLLHFDYRHYLRKLLGLPVKWVDHILILAVGSIGHALSFSAAAAPNGGHERISVEAISSIDCSKC